MTLLNGCQNCYSVQQFRSARNVPTASSTRCSRKSRKPPKTKEKRTQESIAPNKLRVATLGSQQQTKMCLTLADMVHTVIKRVGTACLGSPAAPLQEKPCPFGSPGSRRKSCSAALGCCQRSQGHCVHDRYPTPTGNSVPICGTGGTSTTEAVARCLQIAANRTQLVGQHGRRSGGEA